MHNVQDRLIIFILVLALSLSGFGQQIKVTGGFVQDSLKVGEDIQYWLTAEYPENIDLILPDTLFSFEPWEFSGKQYFPSRIKGDLILDSAVYSLQSYEIDKVQYLSLPAFVINKSGDTTGVKSSRDSIFFFEMAPLVSDTTKLKTNLAYQKVSGLINFPLIWIILGALVVILVLTYFIFGKRIRKALKLRKLKKEYVAFSEQLTVNIRSLKNGPDLKIAELAISQWKQFLEKLENRPFSKLTTKEIMALEYTSELNGTLKNIDRCVYGGKSEDTLYKDFQSIEDFTQHRYSVIVDQIKND
ncbi:MAG: hypothetical protein RIC35_18560 [Marinoscillum sp.]